jgi:hypothetical protein
MPDYRRLTLNPNGVAPEAVGVAAVPLQATSAAVAHQAQHGLDTLLGSGHRVVFEFGLRGGDNFLVLDAVDPDYLGGVRQYPDLSTGRVIGRGHQLALTPGHFLGLDVVALPSGPTQIEVGGAGWAGSGVSGSFVLDVTYDNGVDPTASASATSVIVGSVELYGGESTPGHAALIFDSKTATPWGIEPDSVLEEKFSSGGVMASWTLTAFGSPRAVDVSVVERAEGVTVDQASTTWPSAMYVGAGGPYDGLPVDFPVEQLTSSDPGAGTIAIGRALLEHGRQLGPVLWWWGSGSEHVSTLAQWISYDGGTGDDEAPPVTGSGTTPLHIPFGAAHNANFPGFLLGHYARQVEHGDAFLDGRTGVLPVWFAVYISSADATATIHTGANNDGWSSIDATTSAGAWEWVIVAGWLEVGTGPEDAPPGRLYVAGAGSWSIRYAGVFERVIA